MRGRGRWRVAGLLRRPGVLAGTAVLMALLLGLGASRLMFETSQDTLVDPSSEVARDNVRYQGTFGGEPMLVLLTGDIREIARQPALGAVRELEDDLRGSGRFASVVGPASALDFAADQLAVAPDMITAAIEREAEAAASTAEADAAASGASPEQQEAAAGRAAAEVRAEGQESAAAELARLTAAGEQSLDNPDFVEFLIFEADGDIRPAMRDAFLDERHALVLVRLPGNASIDEQARGADLVEEIVASDPVPGAGILATGSPVLLGEINDYLRGGMATLGAIAVGVMVVLLVLVFRARWPLLPLGVVVVGLVGAFGLVGLLDIPLTLVTISALPILLGLGVDFAIQLHNRFEEERSEDRSPDLAAGRSLARIGPPVLLAMAAAVAGFVSLQWSRVPMIRDFGGLLSVGVVVLVIVALLVVVPVLLLRDRRRPERPPRHEGRVERSVRRLASVPARAAVPLLVVAAVVTVAGFAVEGRLAIQTDPEAWVDQDGRAVTELRELREGTGFSADLSVFVEAPDVTAPEVAAWMDRFGGIEVDQHADEVRRVTSMAEIAHGVHGSAAGGDDLRLLDSVAPPDIARSLISADRTRANIVFPIAPISLQERERVLDEMTADLEGDLAPPPGVTATPSGLVVTGIELVNSLEAGRRTLSLLALGFVLALLVIVQRRIVAPILVLVPVAVAVGLSSLVIAAIGIELTPLTTVVGPLVIAICTEFAVLVVARYAEDRREGISPHAAIDTGVPRIGRAFVASGLTLIGGFGVLAASPMPLLRDFGIVVAIDVATALASTLVLLPPLLLWTDGRGWLRLPEVGGVAEPEEVGGARPEGVPGG